MTTIFEQPLIINYFEMLIPMKVQSMPQPVANVMQKAYDNASLSNLQDCIHLLNSLLQILQLNHFADIPATRHYTIQEFMYPSRARVPDLRIKGSWVGEMGFRPGQKVHIIPLRELLIICPDKTLNRPAEKLINKTITRISIPAVKGNTSLAEWLNMPLAG